MFTGIQIHPAAKKYLEWAEQVTMMRVHYRNGGLCLSKNIMRPKERRSGPLDNQIIIREIKHHLFSRSFSPPFFNRTSVLVMNPHFS